MRLSSAPGLCIRPGFVRLIARDKDEAECGSGGGIISLTMTDEQFTPRAAVLWGTIPKKAREQILKNVFCAECRGSVEIINFTGEASEGNLLLKGSCAKCGHPVARLVETSQADSSGN